MRISRIGFTPLKGARHASHDTVALTAAGPEGDRAFCLVDPARDRVLRTVENPTLLQAAAAWADGVLAVDLAGRRLEDRPVGTGEMRTVDYWGRPAEVETVAGPWSAAFSEHLGYPVLLAHAHPGDVVYGAAVTVLTTASMDRLTAETGAAVDSARFRSTFLLETDGPAHEEDGWVGRSLRLGEATVRVRAVVPRCAVVDLNPATGRRDLPVLATLAGYRRGQGEINFGIDAVVVTPGRVGAGDRASVGRG